MSLVDHYSERSFSIKRGRALYRESLRDVNLVHIRVRNDLGFNDYLHLNFK